MLKELMNELVVALRREIERRLTECLVAEPGCDLHQEICVRLADQFELWDLNDLFPTWLSRVVEGELADARNGGGWWFVGEEPHNDTEGHRI